MILPAYTYATTANVIMHCGATPVFVDVNKDDFNISVKEIEKKINNRTKVVMPVDFGGYPCDYEAINKLVQDKKDLFVANGENQKALGRILVLSDAAHSMGGTYKGKKTGSLTDVSVFSFHAVKNLSTAEGGAVATPDGDQVYLRTWENSKIATRKYKGLEIEGNFNRVRIGRKAPEPCRFGNDTEV